MADITGFDASRHQGELDQAGMAASSDVFGFLKITDGIAYRYVDWFFRNAPKVVAAGKILGAYHFLLDHHPGEAQARYYVEQVQRMFPGFIGLVPIIDIEREADGTTPRIEHLRAFVAEFWRLVPGRIILVYTGRWYWVGVIGNPYGADLGLLWHSEYDGINPIEFDVANGPELDAYGGWEACSIWQHTSSGSTAGITGRSDRNLSYISVDALRQLARLDATPPLPTPPKEDDDMPYLVRENVSGGVVEIGNGPPTAIPFTAYQAEVTVLRQINFQSVADWEEHIRRAQLQWNALAGITAEIDEVEEQLAALVTAATSDT